MKILQAGHEYQLSSLDGGVPQILSFVMRQGKKFPFNADSHPGTNVQEVVRALIDRTRYLDSQDPCAETKQALACLETVLLLYELRAARRHGRHLELDSIQRLVSGPVCSTCGHFGCVEHAA